MKGFQKEYGVKIIETNFDSYESMLAKLGSGNQYDVIFPGAKFVDQLRGQGKLQRIDKTQLENSDQVFGVTNTSTTLVRRELDFSVPFTMYKTGIAYRKDKVTTMTESGATSGTSRPRARSTCSTRPTRRSAWRPQARPRHQHREPGRPGQDQGVLLSAKPCSAGTRPTTSATSRAAAPGPPRVVRRLHLPGRPTPSTTRRLRVHRAEGGTPDRQRHLRDPG
jgi:hypothetical protein